MAWLGPAWPHAYGLYSVTNKDSEHRLAPFHGASARSFRSTDFTHLMDTERFFSPNEINLMTWILILPEAIGWSGWRNVMLGRPALFPGYNSSNPPPDSPVPLWVAGRMLLEYPGNADMVRYLRVSRVAIIHIQIPNRGISG